MPLDCRGTALWLIAVLGAQSGGIAALLVGACLGAVLLLLWAQRRLHGFTPARAAGTVAVASLAAFVPPSLYPPTAAPPASAVTTAELWRPFDAAQIPMLAKAGHAVIVDVTAAWCITCHVNERMVLDRAPVVTALAHDNVRAMKADWTRVRYEHPRRAQVAGDSPPAIGFGEIARALRGGHENVPIQGGRRMA